MSTVGVLFDFDGTLGDTESPAMDVAFWELAPYIPSLGGVAEDGAALDKERAAFVVANAGKAFEFMCELVDAERATSGLAGVEAAFTQQRSAKAMEATPIAAAVAATTWAAMAMPMTLRQQLRHRRLWPSQWLRQVRLR